MRKAKVAILIVAFGMLGGTMAYGEQYTKDTKQPTAKEQLMDLKAACNQDISQLCKDVVPGEGRVASCLHSKSDRLTVGCRDALAAANAKISRKIDKASVAFRRDCGMDAQKFCATVPAGKGRLLECLNLHEDELSPSCKKFQTTMNQKIDEMLGPETVG